MAITTKDVLYLIGGREFNSRIQSYSLSYGVAPQEDNTLNDTTESVMPGLFTIGTQIDGFHDGEVEPVLEDSHEGENDLISLIYGKTPGSYARFFRALLSDYTPIQAATGEPVGFSAGGSARKSNLVHGVLLAHEVAVDSAGESEPIQLGPVAEGKRLFVGLHVLNVNDPLDELEVVIESDATDDFDGDQSEIGAFEPINAIGSQLLILDGPFTDEWFRVTFPTVSGDTPEFRFLVVIGII